MASLNDLRPNASVRGIIPDALATVVSVKWFGTSALELTFKDPSGKVANRLLYRNDEEWYGVNPCIDDLAAPAPPPAAQS